MFNQACHGSLGTIINCTVMLQHDVKSASSGREHDKAISGMLLELKAYAEKDRSGLHAPHATTAVYLPIPASVWVEEGVLCLRI